MTHRGKHKPTHDQVLAAGYPEQIARIRELSERKFLTTKLMFRAPDVLSAAFLWHDTDEGWEFWNDLYERGPRRVDGEEVGRK